MIIMDVNAATLIAFLVIFVFTSSNVILIRQLFVSRGAVVSYYYTRKTVSTWLRNNVKVSLRFGTAGWYCFMKGKIRFSCFVSLEEGLCPLFKPHFWECVVNKILWIAALHKVLFKFCNGFFTNSRGPTRVYFWAFPDTSELSLCTTNSCLSRTLSSSFFFPTPSPVWRLFAFISFLKVPHDFIFLSAMLFCYG